MPLTTAQRATLRASIQVTPEANALYIAGDLDGLAAYYNAVAAPDYWVWRTLVPDSDIYETTTSDGTSWSWPAYIARTQAERDAWRQMVLRGGLNASLANVRQGVVDIFSGTTGAAQRAHLMAVSRRKATRCEQVLSTGTGSSAAPAVLSFEGTLTSSDLIGL